MAIATTKDRPNKKQVSDTATIFNRGELYSGTALSFDGVNDVIDAGNLSATFNTIHFIFNPDTGTESIMDFDGGTHSISITAGVVAATGFDTPTIYIDGFEGTTVAFNNKKYTTVTITTATAITASDFEIGRISTTYFAGEIAGVILYNVALTSLQVERIFFDPGRPIAPGLTTDDLLLWYPMCEANDTIGKVFDYSGNNYHATITGATTVEGIERPLLQTATVGSSVKDYFDGTNDSVAIGTLAAPTSISISMWVLTSDFGSSRRPIRYGNLFIAFQGFLFVYYYPDGSTLKAFTVSTYSNKLTHVLITQTGTIASLYMNGVLIETDTVAAINTGSAASTIGNYSTNYYKGFIDEVAVWDTALNENAAAAIYNEGAALDVTTNSSNYTESDNLIGYWRNNDWTDLSSSGNDGTVSGTPETFVTTKGIGATDGLGFPIKYPQGAAILRGSQYAVIPDNSTFDLTTTVTLCAWVKLTALGSQVHVIDRTSGYDLIISSTNKVIFGFYQTGIQFVTGATTLVADTWYYIAGVYDGTNTKAYLNGVEDVTSASYSGSIDSVSSDIYIGSLSGSSQFVNGVVDDAKIYSSALSAAQILSNYRAGLAQHTN